MIPSWKNLDTKPSYWLKEVDEGDLSPSSTKGMLDT